MSERCAALKHIVLAALFSGDYDQLSRSAFVAETKQLFLETGRTESDYESAVREIQECSPELTLA